MSSEKFVICSHCGAIVNKNDLFCGTCGGALKEQKMGPFKSSNTSPPSPRDSCQSDNLRQLGDCSPSQMYGQQTIYDQRESYAQEQIENKLKFAWLFAWLTLCMGGTKWLILTIFYAFEAKNLGSTDHKIRNSIIIAAVGAVLHIIFKTIFSIFVYIPFLQSLYGF